MEESKYILLCVTGLTPQVVTETLYALYKAGEALPTEIFILTTAEGAERARLTLINDNWLQRFCNDYQLPVPEFNASHIRVLKDTHNQPLHDIRSQQDNHAMADGITEMIRQLTVNSADSLHVSIAGGRKTMGFYAGYALSLYGRKQDRLSHVLISADYESHPQFYYPTPYMHTIYANDKTHKPLDTRQAEVMLADIAFVRFRHGLDENLLQGKTSFSASVKQAQKVLGPPQILLDLQNGFINAQGIQIKCMSVDLAFYSWLLKRQIDGETLPVCPSEGAPELMYAEQYLQHYLLIKGEMGATDRTTLALQQGMSKAFFEQRKSRINRQIKNNLGMHAEPYLISATGKRPQTRYKIQLEKDQIHYQES